MTGLSVFWVEAPGRQIWMIYIKKQNAAIDYLLSEILEDPQTSHIPIWKQSQIRTYKCEERAHLEKEIIGYLQNRMEQLWMEPTKSAISKLRKQINRLPEGVSGKEDLIKGSECLESMNEELNQCIEADHYNFDLVYS